MVDLLEKVYLNLILADLVKKNDFQKNGVGGHFGLSPLAKNAEIFFSEGPGFFHIFYKRSIVLKSIVKVC